jgi:hypothetical protein
VRQFAAPLGEPIISPVEPNENGAASALLRKTFRIEVLAGVLWSGSYAVLEMGPALAKKAYDASDLQVALLTSGQSVGLLLSFFTSHLAAHQSRVRLAFWLHVLSNLALVPIFFLRPSFALLFVVLHAASRVGHAMAVPARILVYQTNFPKARRGNLVGRLNRIKLCLTTTFAFLLSVLLDWNVDTEELVKLLGPCPVPADDMVRWVIPALGVLGLIGCMVYRTMPEATTPGADDTERKSVYGTFKEFVLVWREDRSFRRYEMFFFVFGFANIMSIPLTQIHAVDHLHANYFDLAMINVVLVHLLMALSMTAWGTRLDRTNPYRMRGILNLVLAIDFIVLALAPTIGWVYVGRLFRGVAMGGGTLLWMLGPLWFAKESRKEPIYTGIHAVLTGLRWSLAPFVAIWLKASFGTDSRPIFWICGAVLVVTGIGMLRESQADTTTTRP